MIMVLVIQIQMFNQFRWMDQVFGNLLQYHKMDNINFQSFHPLSEKVIFGNQVIMEAHGGTYNSVYLMDFDLSVFLHLDNMLQQFSLEIQLFQKEIFGCQVIMEAHGVRHSKYILMFHLIMDF